LNVQEMTFMTKQLLSTVVGLALAGCVYGQSGVNQRRENQQDRIAQGAANGQLTAGEAAKLESKEAKINQEIRTERKANGGNLTNNEKKQVNRQQNRVSKQIAAEKHDAATQNYGKNEVDARRKAQQERIAKGVAAGTVKPAEAARLEKQEAKVNQEVRTERKANGGNLTNNEKKQVNRQLNRESKRIHAAKQ
jgi:hypothetical protein